MHVLHRILIIMWLWIDRSALVAITLRGLFFTMGPVSEVCIRVMFS